MSTPIPVFLVDDHPLVREGLAHLLRGAGYALAGEAAGEAEAFAHPGLAGSRLVLVDLALGEESGLPLLARLRGLGLTTLVYSMHQDPTYIRRALEAGASGYVTKREAAGSLLEAVQAVLGGNRYLSPRAKEAFQDAVPRDSLSVQQQQLYQLLGRGYANDEIARQLNLSVRTVESYCSRMMDKLGVDGMRELRRRAIRDSGSLPPEPAP